jgi:hypothetical protein
MELIRMGTKVCGRCGKSFKQKTKWHDFCTRECQLAYYYSSKVDEAKKKDASSRNRQK